MAGRFDNIHPGLTCDHAREIIRSPVKELESQSDVYMAAAHLINCPGEETENVLCCLLEGNNNDQPIKIAKRKAVEVLARLGCVNSIPAIAKCLWSDDQYLVENTVWALQRMKCSEPKLIARVLELLDDPFQNQRVLIQYLAALNVQHSVEKVQQFQFSETAGVRGAAISAIAQLTNDSKIVSTLTDHLMLPNQMDRQCAIQDIIDAGAVQLLPSVIKAPVSPAFRMRACRTLIKHKDQDDLSLKDLELIDFVLDDSPDLIELVHRYDNDPSPDFLVRDLFHTDFSRCYLALKALKSFPSADLIFPILKREWESEAHNDYGAHYFFIRLFGSRSDWSEVAMEYISHLLNSAIQNQRPQFQKSRAAAIYAYGQLFPNLFPCKLYEFLDPTTSPPWDCRYVFLMILDKLSHHKMQVNKDLFNHFLDDQDPCVRARLRFCDS